MPLKTFSYWGISILLFGVLCFGSCIKRTNFLDSGGVLAFSEDTVHFDTVFSSAKSSTHLVKVYNKESQFVKISLNLQNANASSYDLVVDGKIGKSINDIEIAPLDSAIVFITMNVDPTDEDIPFIVEDMLVAQVNNLSYSIPIIGYAQNAYYINDSVLTTMTLLTDKPYVIINSALVAEGETLTVPAGVKIYMHRNSRLFVQGTLKMMGTLDNKIEMQGDRIDRRIYVGTYDDVPGEWGGIYFFPTSHDNEIHYSIIKNGGLSTNIGASSTQPAMIQVDKDTRNDGTPKLKLTNTMIRNSVAYGIIAFESSIEAENCLIVNAQDVTLALTQGGKYNFYDCTIGSPGGIRFFSRVHGTVSVGVQNYYKLTETTYNGANLDAKFVNCILYGNNEEEFVASKVDDYAASIILDHCLIRHKEPIADFVTMNSMMVNVDPLFADLSISDFNLQSTSPVIGRGISAGSLDYDYNGNPRSAIPSIGAMEYVP